MNWGAAIHFTMGTIEAVLCMLGIDGKAYGFSACMALLSLGSFMAAAGHFAADVRHK